MPEIEFPAAERLQVEHSQYIVQRHRDGDDHRRDCQLVITEYIADERYAHEHDIAAEQCLYHSSAAPVILFDSADHDDGQHELDEHRHPGEQEHIGTERRLEIRRVDVVEHHTEKENLEHHAVHVRGLELGQQVHALHYDAHTDEHEQRHDRPDSD